LFKSSLRDYNKAILIFKFTVYFRRYPVKTVILPCSIKQKTTSTRRTMGQRKHPILQRIEQGEGLHLDFKFEVSDAPKIARSLVAFANTEGGTLLIGVKDNGKIAGVRSEEEFFMIENAAMRYCQPEVTFHTKEWNIGGKKVLEVIIPKGDKIPYRAPDTKGNLKAYIRIADENILASGIQMKLWKAEKSRKEIRFTDSTEERKLLTCLKENEPVGLRVLKKRCRLSSFRTEKLLTAFVLLGLVKMETTAEDVIFSLENLPETDEWMKQ
jgi:predicted HTH transcriptional regulator